MPVTEKQQQQQQQQHLQRLQLLLQQSQQQQQLQALQQSQQPLQQQQHNSHPESGTTILAEQTNGHQQQQQPSSSPYQSLDELKPSQPLTSYEPIVSASSSFHRINTLLVTPSPDLDISSESEIHNRQAIQHGEHAVMIDGIATTLAPPAPPISPTDSTVCFSVGDHQQQIPPAAPLVLSTDSSPPDQLVPIFNINADHDNRSNVNSDIQVLPITNNGTTNKSYTNRIINTTNRTNTNKNYKTCHSKYSYDYFDQISDFHLINGINHIPQFENAYLHPNAQFIGEQQSGKSRFHIKVEFKTVDLINSAITGFLQISGLTEEHSEIITCFKGEIINNPLYKYKWKSNKNSFYDPQIKNYSFITENKYWGSFPKNDFEHWKKLTNCSDLDDEQLKQRLNRIQQGQEDNQFIYMRWKEEFLLPDSRVKQISGASFEGFYYIVLNVGGYPSTDNSMSRNGSLECLRFSNNIVPGSISGLYYHKSSEKFQSLSLRYVADHGVSNNFEFV